MPGGAERGRARVQVLNARPRGLREDRRHGNLHLGDFQLTPGVVLPGAKLAYTTVGTLSDATDNAVLFPTFLGGAEQALKAWIGEGRALDPTKYFFILSGHFGLPPTSSPSNTGPPFDLGAFPAVHIADDVIAQRRLLSEHFGIEELQLVLGWSVAALQTYEWAVRFAQMVKRMASIAGAPRPSPWTRLWLTTCLEEPLTSDPNWNNGFYRDAGDIRAGVRHMAHATALTLPPQHFYREGHEVWRNLGFPSDRDFIARFWEAFWLAHDPNDVVAQARKARTADPGGADDIGRALGTITAKALVVAFTGDPMFQPDECELDAKRIPDAEFRRIESDFGHLATFSLSADDVQAVDRTLSELLAR